MTLKEDSYTTVSWQPRPAPAAVVPHQQNFVGRLWKWFSKPPTGGPAAIILIRLMAGGVFFWEGILKFVYHNQGGGRFALIGIPLPETMATFVALLEIVGGLLLISGLFTRWITVPFIVEMLVAMLSTKIAMYLGTSPLPLPAAPPKTGLWAVLHEIRSEYAQLMSVTFLLFAGPGPWSIDALAARRRTRQD
jgi:putative oxidoreductase